MGFFFRLHGVAPDRNLTATIPGSGEGSQLWGHSGDIGIGRNDGQTRYHNGASNTQYAFAGLIDDVRIYNRTLDDNEAETLWLFF